MLPSRKRPVLYELVGSVITPLAYFKDVAAMETFLAYNPSVNQEPKEAES